ncbi:hypothetical protein MIND_00223500 [Mycena indigotica]|uniref:Uncharacterized protein n=1 Tax=Mycena indigotica TaxID=2126181 RepID=A0A8H6T857_9AGAR|nr:uncharacterized protein MIND_00223500 [Mycena indigotica]KAF7312112.1 hypothetical protein MIND_00223500 [Mycena indigotica]
MKGSGLPRIGTALQTSQFISIARMHHIRSRSKFRRLQQRAEAAPVLGLAKSGRPGILVVQGTKSAISAFLEALVAGLRYLDFHHIATRPLNADVNLMINLKSGLVEVNRVKDLVQALESIGLKEWFRTEMHMGKDFSSSHDSSALDKCR